MNHILTLVDARVVAISAVLLVASIVAAVVTQRRNGPAMYVFVALSGSALVMALTLANRGIVDSAEDLGHALTWWTRNWTALPSLIGGDLGWWLNIVLFIPAALGWTLLTRRPKAVAAALTVAVLVIETLHATMLSGAGDPSDVVANVTGIVVGIGLGALLRGAQPAMPEGDTR